MPSERSSKRAKFYRPSKKALSVDNMRSCKTIKSNYKQSRDHVISPREVLASQGIRVKHTLGAGSYSKVKFGQCETNGDVAVKIISRIKSTKHYIEKFLPRELAVLKKIQHPHIITMHDTFETEKHIYIVMDYAPNGDALTYVQQRGALDENHARTWSYQIVDAVTHLHDRGIAHRDIKLENLVLDDGNNLKLCDFGFAKEHCFKELSNTSCGSIYYAAPEILHGDQYEATKVDIWSIGVCIFALVTGCMPFGGDGGTRGILLEHTALNLDWSRSVEICESKDDSNPETEEDIQSNKNRGSGSEVSTNCRKLVLSTFVYDYRDRPSIHEIGQHVWFKPMYRPRVRANKSMGKPDSGNSPTKRPKSKNSRKMKIQESYYEIS